MWCIWWFTCMALDRWVERSTARPAARHTTPHTHTHNTRESGTRHDREKKKGRRDVLGASERVCMDGRTRAANRSQLRLADLSRASACASTHSLSCQQSLHPEPHSTSKPSSFRRFPFLSVASLFDSSRRCREFVGRPLFGHFPPPPLPTPHTPRST